MALAKFFDRAALAASQILRGFDRAAFEEALNSRVVGVSFDDAAAESPEGRITLELTVNLLARLYPRLALVPIGATADEAAGDLVSVAREINPMLEIETGLESASACVAVGVTEVDVAAPVAYVGSDGWVVHLSSRSPVGSGATTNPFGAAAAACFGAANVFRVLFGSQLVNGALDEYFAFSLLDYDPIASVPYNPALGPIDLGESHLVGLGAIGNGAVWALSKMPQLGGLLHLVDEELVDLGNLQRYVLTKQTDVGTSKVELTAEHLRGTGLDPRPHPARWGTYLRARENWDLRRVAVALDSAEDRIAVQASLPRWVVNAWTQPGDLGVSRHAFLDDQACLACLYLPDGERKNEDQLVAEAMGLPEALMEVRTLLYTREPVGRQLVERIASALGVPIEPLLPFEGRSLRELYIEGICSGIVLELGGRANGESRIEVPMAFQSTLAGVMLAAELVANAGGIKDSPPPVATKIDLLRPLRSYLHVPAAKHPSGRCICQDQDYVSSYRAKYERL